MKRDQQKNLAREKRQAQSARVAQKKAALLEQLESLDEIEPDVEAKESIVATPEIEEVTEKDMGMDCMPMATPVMGPTSWDELDQATLEQERTEALEETTWNVRMLVNNILSAPLDLKEKSAAIQAVGSGFSERADQILAASTEEDIDAVEEKDLDLLSLQALLAHDKRNASVLDVIKAKLSYAAKQDHPDGDFALVREETGKSGKKIKVRKYLVHDASHVRNALSRAAAQIAGGNAQDAADARAALPKIHAAAKKFGIDSNTKKERNAVMVEKDAKGDWRWVGWVSNNFQDWDGDIISKEAHEEYVAWWEKNQEVSPVFVTWHTPGTARKYPVDFMTFENGFLIVSGKLEESEAEGLLKAQAMEEQGMSHGTFVFERDPKDPRVITKYRMYECSDLPLDRAANPFTDFETIVKEVGMDKFKYLAAILGSEEKAKKFMDSTGMKQKALQDAGVEQKEKTEAAPTAPVAAAPVAVDDVVAKVLKEMDIEGLNDFVVKAQEAMEEVPVLKEVIQKLQADSQEVQKDADEKLAEKLTPPVSRFAWSRDHRPTAAKENVVKGDEKLATEMPGVPEDYWLSQATGTTPVAVVEQK